jgi:SAM-dependent methyltransferase
MGPQKLPAGTPCHIWQRKRLIFSGVGTVHSARAAYDRFAAIYDECNAQNDYERWLGTALLPTLRRFGLRNGRALDIGCGTGKAFPPLLKRGWTVSGCDVSPAMLDVARRKFGDRVPLYEFDARDVPRLETPDAPATGGCFQLVLLLNDVVNYLTDNGDLSRAFAAVRRNLTDGGLAAFDANSISLFRHAFGSGISEIMDERGVTWRGLAGEVHPGGTFEAQLSGRGVETHIHRQRHWTAQEIRAALAGAGLACVAAMGQSEDDGDIILSEPPNEEREFKVIYVAAPM